MELIAVILFSGEESIPSMTSGCMAVMTMIVFWPSSFDWYRSLPRQWESQPGKTPKITDYH